MICQVTEVDSFLCNYNGNLMDGEKECSDAILREKMMMRIVSVEMENQFGGNYEIWVSIRGKICILFVT